MIPRAVAASGAAFRSHLAKVTGVFDETNIGACDLNMEEKYNLSCFFYCVLKIIDQIARVIQ